MPLVLRAVVAVPGREVDVATPDDEEVEAVRGAVAAAAVLLGTCMDEGRARF